jgi:putative ABC transport system permease protein
MNEGRRSPWQPAGSWAGWLRLSEGVRQAGQVITGHKMRSALLIVGVAIGVATLLAIFTIVTGLSDKIRNDIVSANKPYIYIGRYQGLGGEDIEALLRRPQLKPELLDAIGEVAGVDAVDYYVSNQDVGGIADLTILQYGKERTNFVQVVGTTHNFPTMLSFTLDGGRFFSAAEVEARARVVVLGHSPSADLFPRLDPLGRTLRIEGQAYTIIGTMEKRESIFGQFGDNYVAVPWTSFEKDFLKPELEDRTMAASVVEGYDTDEVMSDIIGVLRKMRHLRPGEPNDFEVTASETFGEVIDKVTGAVSLVLVVLSSIGLMVGGIGVMNIMLISVTERTREIGVRMAIGARREDVLLQVLVEAATLTGIGESGGAHGPHRSAPLRVSTVPGTPGPTLASCSQVAGFPSLVTVPGQEFRLIFDLMVSQITEKQNNLSQIRLHTRE